MKRLNLGCGTSPLTDYINHDISIHAPYVNVAWDLRDLPWPWMDREIDHINAWMVLEHMPEVIPFFNECHRILKSGGALDLCVPWYKSDNVAVDPTHYRGFHVRSCDILDPDTELGQKALHYTPYKWQVKTAQMGVDIDHESVWFYLVKRS